MKSTIGCTSPYIRMLTSTAIASVILGFAHAALAAPTVSDIRIVATEFKYEPSEIRVKAGTPVNVILDNSKAATEHGIAIPGMHFRLDARAGQMAQKSFLFKEPGTYAIVCDLPGHSESGMTGTLVVQK